MTLDIQALLSDEQAKQDYSLLRLEIANVLEAKPWKHKWEIDIANPLVGGDLQNYVCSKCGKKETAKLFALLNPMYTGYCDRPNLPTEPFEVLSERLVKKVLERDYGESILSMAVAQYWRKPERGLLGCLFMFESLQRWWKMSLAERAFCCIKPLEGKAKPEGHMEALRMATKADVAIAAVEKIQEELK